MQAKVRNIAPSQLVLLLFISRFFTLMTYSPHAAQSVSGSGALLTQPLSALLSFVALLPFLWLAAKRGRDPLACAFGVGRVYGVLAAGLLGLFCLQTAALSTGQFTFFMTGTVYQSASPLPFLLLLAAVAAYGAAMGLEAFSRMSTLVFALIVAVGLLLGLLLLPEIRTVYLVSPLLDGAEQLWSGVLRGVYVNAELVLFLLLLPRTKNGGGKTAAGWLLLTALAFELMTFLLLTTLGNYAGTRLFPMHTAAALAQFGTLGRLDLLHIIVWVFVAFLRVTLYLYGGAVCLRRIFPRLRMGVAAALCGAAVAGVSALIVLRQGVRTWAEEPLTTGLPLLLLVVVLPLVTLLFSGARGKEAAKGGTA